MNRFFIGKGDLDIRFVDMGGDLMGVIEVNGKTIIQVDKEFAKLITQYVKENANG